MWMSVPQMPVLCTFTSTSSGPISGTGRSSVQMPGSDLALTRAFILLAFRKITGPGGPEICLQLFVCLIEFLRAIRNPAFVAGGLEEIYEQWRSLPLVEYTDNGATLPFQLATHH